MTKKALIIVDVQNDFCEGGSLAVAGGASVARAIDIHVMNHENEYDLIVATADWHIDPGSHFSPLPDYVDSWPEHCKAGTKGADFHENLRWSYALIDAVFTKGEYSASYSGFDGSHKVSKDTEIRQSLAAYLIENGIDEVDVVGIAFDYCVKATALDAADMFGFKTNVLIGLTAAVHDDQQSIDEVLRDFADAGVQVVHLV